MKVTVSCQVVGGKLQLKEAETIADLKQQLGLTNHQASINGEPAEDSQGLEEGNFVTFAPKVKGA